MEFLSVVWDVNPVAFSIGSLSVRWYGIMWALGIYLCYLIQDNIYKREHHPQEWIDKLFMYMVLGSIIGARLGHCLFYEWHSCEQLELEPIQIFAWNITYRNPYIEHPLEMLKIWQGGLASHGGAIGLIIAAFMIDRKIFHKGIPWLFDRLVIGVAVAGFLIRLGNLFNSEIYGGPTNLPWGFIFVRDGQTEPCHPTQIYEMLYCLVAFVVSAWMYYKTKAARRPGLIFGVWLEIVFFTRFMLEFIKFNQEAFESNMFLNMGQLLSLPFIIWGIWLMVRAMKRPMLPDPTLEPSKKTKK